MLGGEIKTMIVFTLRDKETKSYILGSTGLPRIYKSTTGCRLAIGKGTYSNSYEIVEMSLTEIKVAPRFRREEKIIKQQEQERVYLG